MITIVFRGGGLLPHTTGIVWLIFHHISHISPNRALSSRILVAKVSAYGEEGGACRLPAGHPPERDERDDPGPGPGLDHHCPAGGMHRRVHRFSSRSPGYWPKPAMIPSGCRGDNCPGTSAPSRCRCCRTVTASTQTAAGPDRGPDEPAGCRTLLLLRKRAIRCIGHCVWQPAVYQRRSGDRQSQGHQRIYAVLR
jgi:hypothetical protein